MILDSSYLSDLMADDPDAFSKGVELVDRGELQRLPTPVVAETYYGVATARSTTTVQEVRNRLLGYPRVDVDEEVARTAGELLAAADDTSPGSSSDPWSCVRVLPTVPESSCLFRPRSRLDPLPPIGFSRRRTELGA